MYLPTTIGRLLRVLRVVAKHSSVYEAGRFARRFAWVSRLIRVVPLSGAERVRATLEAMRGTFICNALFSLLDRESPYAIEKLDGRHSNSSERYPWTFDPHVLCRFHPEIDWYCEMVPAAAGALGI